jgi:hypothetical protein
MTERLTDDELNKILSGNYDNETIVFLLGGEEDDRVLNRLLLSLRQQNRELLAGLEEATGWIALFNLAGDDLDMLNRLEAMLESHDTKE